MVGLVIQKCFFFILEKKKNNPTSVRQRASTGAFLHVWEDVWFPQVFWQSHNCFNIFQLGGQFNQLTTVYTELGPKVSNILPELAGFEESEQNFNFRRNSSSKATVSTNMFLPKNNHNSLRITFPKKEIQCSKGNERHVPNIGKYMFQISFFAKLGSKFSKLAVSVAKGLGGLMSKLFWNFGPRFGGCLGSSKKPPTTGGIFGMK